MTDTTQPPQTGVTPQLVCKNGFAAIDFYVAAFGATELMRLPGKDGLLMHAALMINGGRVLLVDEFPDMGDMPAAAAGSRVTLHMVVPDAAAAIDRAVAAGAALKMPATPMFWGDLYGMVTDPFGHVWAIATPMGPPKTGEELVAAMRDA